MNHDFEKLLKRLMDAKGLGLLFIKDNNTDLTSFDSGFRKQFFPDYPFDYFTSSIDQLALFTLFHLQDTYYLHYNVCKIKDSDENPTLVFLIGPYLLDSDPVDYTHIIERNSLPLYALPHLESFYSSIPVIQSLNMLENEILAILDFYFPDIAFSLNSDNTVDYFCNISDTQIEYDYDHSFFAKNIEDIYLEEDALLNAVRRGDYTRAFQSMQTLSHYDFSKTYTADQQKLKHYIIAQNALFRKEVQHASVHPAYVEQLSDSFINRIDKASNALALTKIYHDMLRKYCLIVQNHSLQKYSKIIQDTMKYIDFHLTEDLSLKTLASRMKTTPSYLSSQFTKEIGTTLTKYVTEKRIEKSLLLLTTTDLQIQQIAEKVGINDENYFSRLFKKTYHMTAREYRNNLRQQ